MCPSVVTATSPFVPLIWSRHRNLSISSAIIRWFRTHHLVFKSSASPPLIPKPPIDPVSVQSAPSTILSALLLNVHVPSVNAPYVHCSILAPPSKASTSNVSVLLFISLPPLNTLHMLFLPLPNTALPLPPTITTPSLLPSPSATGLNLIVRVKALALKQLITSTKIFAQLIRWKWPSGSTVTCCGLFLQMTHNRRAICARKQAPNYTLNNRFCHGWEMCELAGHRNVFSIMIKRSRDKWN